MLRKLIFFCTVFCACWSFASTDTLRYEVRLKDRAQHLFKVNIHFKSQHTGVMDFKMAQWTPGYYQMLHFENNLSEISAKSEENPKLEIIKTDKNTWRLPVENGQNITLSYTIKADAFFIAKPFISEEFAFLRPTGVFLYSEERKNDACTVRLVENPWGNVATALPQKNGYFIAKNTEELLDSPILTGNIDKAGRFMVGGKPHYFFGRQIDDFDTQNMMQALQKAVEQATVMMQDIPYESYTFMSIGKGNGGIEQTNSTAFTLNGELYETEEGRQKLLNFLTHEYFHHFNIKRMTPFELMPLDYSEENRTNLLWVSEGLTVYYESILLNRGGIKNRGQMLQEWGNMITGYENNEGKKFQTLADSSRNTWEDGPFGVKGKTISYYQKGPLIGMLLDLKIRHNTQNKKSLDDVMRTLYWQFYKKENRGFTEKELKTVCENLAQENLDAIFKYIYTLDALDYSPYFKFAGLEVIETDNNGQKNFRLQKLKKTNTLQNLIFNDLFRGK